MALTQVPIELSSTPGIVDNSNATAITIDSSERIGIGTSSPTYKFNVLASSGSQNIFQAGQSGVSNGLSITSNGSALTYSFLTGNVGIGTSAPGSKVDIVAADNTSLSPTLRVNSNNVAVNAALAYDGLVGSGEFELRTSGASALKFATNATERMRILSGGNVLIGRSSEPYVSGNVRLHVEGPLPATDGRGQMAIATTAAYNATDRKAMLNFSGAFDTVGTPTYLAGIAGEKENTTNNNYGGALTLHTRPNGGALAERLRIDSSGNVLVGRTSRLTNQVESISSDTVVSIHGFLSSHQTNCGVLQYNTNTFVLRAYGATAGTGQMAFQVGGGGGGADFEAMRIDSIGNLSLGATSALSGARISCQGPANDNQQVLALYNPGTTGATTYLQSFATNTTYTERGYITWNGSTMSLSNASDIRLKENVLSAPSALPVIDSIKVKSFDFKEDGRHVDYGVIAQELYEVFPSAVSQGTDKEDGSIEKPWAVGLEPTIPLLIKAIQEQQATIESQAAAITDLTTRLTALENN